MATATNEPCMGREKALKICTALTVVAMRDGLDKAKELVDVWVDLMEKKTGYLDIECKTAAYDYFDTLEPVREAQRETSIVSID